MTLTRAVAVEPAHVTGSVINSRSKTVIINEEQNLTRSLWNDSGKQNRWITRVQLPETGTVEAGRIQVVRDFGKVYARQPGPREELLGLDRRDPSHFREQRRWSPLQGKELQSSPGQGEWSLGSTLELRLGRKFRKELRILSESQRRWLEIVSG